MGFDRGKHSCEILKYSNTAKCDSGQCNLLIDKKYQIFKCPGKVMPASQSIDVMNLFRSAAMATSNLLPMLKRSDRSLVMVTWLGSDA